MDINATTVLSRADVEQAIREFVAKRTNYPVTDFEYKFGYKQSGFNESTPDYVSAVIVHLKVPA